ncbi:MAG: ABC transporter ATP-binding protein [Phycisphaerae bacterium]
MSDQQEPNERSDDAPQDHPLDHLPAELLTRVQADARPDDVVACAPFDLDADGMYLQGQLILTDRRLGSYCRCTDDGDWTARWHEIGRLGDVRLVEGLGVNLLRLLADGKVVTEYYYTLRHAKSVARLHRRIEHRLKGEDESQDLPAEPERPDEKLRCEKCGRVIPAWAETCPACMSRRKILFRLLDYVRPYQWRMILGICLAVAGTGMGIAQPLLTKPMIDRGLGGTAGFQPDLRLFLIYLSCFAGLMIVSSLTGAIQRRLVFRLGTIVSTSIRDTVYAHLHRLSLSFFANKQTGSLVTRVTRDSDRLWGFLAFTCIEVVVGVLTIVGVSVAMFVVNWKLACFALIPIPLMLFLMVLFHRKMHRLFRKWWHRWGQLTAVVADALPGVRVIKAFSQERREIERFGVKNRLVYDQEMTFISTVTVFGPLMMFCTQLSVLVVWIVGGMWVVQDYPRVSQLIQADPRADAGAFMTVGTLFAYMGLLHMFLRPIHMVAHMDEMFNRAATSAQRIFEVLDAEPTIFSKSGAKKVVDLCGRIELRDVSFTYDGIRKVLRNVDLTVEPGQMVGLAGPSGGGKTTLVNLICRFYDVLEGQILIDGVDVRDYDVQDLRSNIGVVLQEPFLFHGTVGENIAYGNAGADMEQIIAAARAANAHDFILGFPDSYDTMVGERGQTLSGGERQRISIARAILNNPKILILDEATSSVDTETEKLIQEALERLVANRTTIAIAHRLSTLRKADWLVVLEKGSVIEQGPHEELASKADGLYAKLLNMQSEAQSLMALGG